MHRAQNVAMTKLRFLASEKVVRAAEALHDIDDRIAELVDGATVPDKDEWDRLRNDRQKLREAFINAGRKELKLKDGASIVT